MAEGQGGVDGPSPKLHWVAAGQKCPTGSIWGQELVASDRDTGHPDVSWAGVRPQPPSLCPLSLLGMRCGPAVALGTNSKGTLASVPRTSVFILRAVSPKPRRVSALKAVEPVLVPPGTGTGR